MKEYNPYSLLKRKIVDFKNSYYDNRSESVVQVCSATKLNNISSNSVDYIFVDPPFGANLMYSELNSIWEGWIKVITNNKEEVIVNNTQHKSIFEDQTLMNNSLTEFYRILKPGKWLTMEFSNTSAAVWNSIQTALQGVGFIVSNVSALDKQEGSFKAVTTTTAVKQDLIISCFKPSSEFVKRIEASQNKVLDAWTFIDEYLAHLDIYIQKGNTTTAVVERSPKILYDRLLTFYIQHNWDIPMDAGEFQKGLAERYIERDGMFFTTAQVSEYESKRKKSSEFSPLGLIISDEANGIEWLRHELVEPQTYQEIHPKWIKNLTEPKKGDMIPELIDILNENFIKDDVSEKWRLPNLENSIDLEKLRIKTLLKEFNYYAELVKKPHAKISEVRLESLRAGFKQCYKDKDFATIISVGDKIPQNLLQEDETLLQFYDIASERV